MSTTTRPTGDESSEPTLALRPATPALEALLTTTGAPDRCRSCGAELAADQRYCVECGTRRGKPRFSAPGTAPATVAASEPMAAPAGARRGPRPAALSAGATLITGIATLLLALGIGVLIGHNNSPAQKSSHITVNVGSGGAPSAASGARTTASGAPAGTGGANASAGHGGKPITGKAAARAIRKPPTKAAAAAAAQAAAGTLKAAPGVKIAPATTKVGGACTAGTAGCQNGKFTGAFFGP